MKLSTNTGYSLAEVLVSVAIFVFLMTGLYTALAAGSLSFQIQNASLMAQREARNAIMQMTKELRMVDGISLTQSSTDVTLLFTDPGEGTVTYSWTNDTSDSNVNRLIRSSASSTRIIAQNISAFAITDNTDNIIIDLTAFGENDSGNNETFQLVKKVGLR